MAAQPRAVLLLYLTLVLPTASAVHTKSYYKILDVEPTASERLIKKAYRNLAVMHHPDKNGNDGSEKTFREIVEAYTLLSNKEMRRLYDTLGHDTFMKNKAYLDSSNKDEKRFDFSFFDMHDIFGDEMNFHWHFSHDGQDKGGLHGYSNFDQYFGDENEDYF